jgi:hypothetical protein
VRQAPQGPFSEGGFETHFFAVQKATLGRGMGALRGTHFPRMGAFSVQKVMLGGQEPPSGAPGPSFRGMEVALRGMRFPILI